MTRGALAASGCAFAVGALSCGSGGRDSGGPQPQGRAASAIESDASDVDHRFAVGVVTTLSPGNVILCSGVLLAPNLVATARHCVATIDSVEVDCATSRFGATFAPSSIQVTADATIDPGSGAFVGVTRVVVASDVASVDAASDPFCGDDLALLVLASSVDLPQYVAPTIDPPMSDRSSYSARVTAIGYGIMSPADVDGSTARVRRIKEDIPLACVPDDPTFAGCFTSPAAMATMSEREFLSGDASTCDGDSGSGAFEQTNFDRGRWVAFGVLSRGAVSADGRTCVQPIYTRFDAWGPLLVATATDAAAEGGYALPAWALPADGSAATNMPQAENRGVDGCTAVQPFALPTPADFAAGGAGLAILVGARRKRHTKGTVARRSTCREPDITR